jgi:hypothetical protein
MRKTPSNHLDRTKVETCASFEDAELADRRYWLNKTPTERLAALELLRHINYGYDDRYCPTSKIF